MLGIILLISMLIMGAIVLFARPDENNMISTPLAIVFWGCFIVAISIVILFFIY